MYRHILIPTDGSELAERGVAHGLALAKSLGAKVSVIFVMEPFSEMTGQVRDTSRTALPCMATQEGSLCGSYVVIAQGA